MLAQKIKITTQDIHYAEKILLPTGRHFDTERRDFIKNLDTIDLQAVPGSGKTTALLAKLLILDKHMPFDDGSGILVISHTNAAIDEIKEKIQKHCPKLFSYPNFIGTIQSFVDKFLAIPFYSNKYKKRPHRIDNEIYSEKIEKHLSRNIKNFSFQVGKNAKYFLIGKKCSHKVRFLYKDGSIKLLKEMNGDPLEIEKPRKGARGWSDFTQEEKSKIKQWIAAFKMKILEEEGVLHFDDAYFIADAIIAKFPKVVKLLQNRFPLVFVDEMQDMEKHQHDILDKLFYRKHVRNHCFQRIGDKNQAIHSNSSHVPEDGCWKDHGRPKTLIGSHRLSKRNADLVQLFGLDNHHQIIGLNNEADIKPHILVYENPLEVLPKYTELIDNHKLSNNKHPFMAVGWTTHKTDEDIQSENIRIQNYHPCFNKIREAKRIDYTVLEDYLYVSESDNLLASARKNILNAVIKVTRLEKITDEYGRYFTISSILSYLRSNFYEHYQELKLLLYQQGIKVCKKEEDDVLHVLREYIPKLMNNVFGIKSYTNPNTETFLNTEGTLKNGNIEDEKNPNERHTHCSNGINVQLGTIHSVKGKTLSAVLYLETFYEGNEAYESARLSNQFLGEPFFYHPKSDKKYHIQSAKMVYVGLSRPTDLLCFAVHKTRFNELLNGICKDTYEVINCPNELGNNEKQAIVEDSLKETVPVLKK